MGFMFLVLAKPEHSSGDEYGRVRPNVLDAYAGALKCEHPDLRQVVGIGFPPEGGETELGVDLFYRDFADWSSADESRAKEDRKRLGVLTRATRTNTREIEYPDLLYLDAGKTLSTLNSGKPSNRRNRRRLAAIGRKKPSTYGPPNGEP